MANFTSTTITLQQREKNHAGARSKRNGVGGNGAGTRWKFMEADIYDINLHYIYLNNYTNMVL